MNKLQNQFTNKLNHNKSIDCNIFKTENFLLSDFRIQITRLISLKKLKHNFSFSLKITVLTL
mgnify:FL=1